MKRYLLLLTLTGSSLHGQAAPATDKKDQTKPETLPTVVVTAQAPTYAPSEATTASKINVPLKDLPASVQVVPKEVLRDRGVTKVEQIAETVSGVHAESSYGNNGATFFNIRGFTASDSLRDGFRNHGYDAFRDVQSIDHIEVMKGPVSALYGSASSLGGNINVLSKRPQNEAFTELGITAGSYGLLRPTLDWNQSSSNGVSMRLNSAYEHNDGFRDRSGYDSFAIAPAVKWDLDQDTSLTVLLEYDHLHRDGFDFGVPNIPAYKSISRTRYFGFDTDYGKNNTYAATVILEHKLNDNWTWREAAHYNYAKQSSGQPFPDIYSYTGGSIVPFTNYPFVNDEHSYDIDLQNELMGKFETGSVKHNMVIGTELSRNESGYGGNSYFGTSLDIYNPGYHAPMVFLANNPSGDQRTDDLGLYIQDLIEITPQWKLLAGLRADWFRTKASSGGVRGSEDTEFDWSPRVGLVWQPVETTSLYFAYNKAYAAVVGHNTTGQSYNAEGGEQYEVGLKQDIIKGKLSANLAAFDLTRTGILTTDPSNPLNQVQTGEQRSRGFEFDLAGEITPAWKLIAAYAFTDAKVSKDNSLPVGDKLSNVPRHSGSLWSTYQFQDGTLKGFGFGAGLTFVGEREANLPNTYKLDSYWRTDASLFYDHGDWRAQVNFLNLFDTHYYTGGQAGVFNYTLDPSRPFSVQATVTYKF